MFLNIYIMIVMFCVTTIPFLVLKPESFSETVNKSQSVYHDQAVNCSRNYQDYIEEIKTLKSTFEKVLDFLQGTVSILLAHLLIVSVIVFSQFDSKNSTAALGQIKK